MTITWPLVDKNDDGLRAIKPGVCFYCDQPIGSEHKRDCIVVKRQVLMTYTYEVVVDVPYDWDEDMINFSKNESSWCANNGIRDIENMTKPDKCLCGKFSAKYIKDLSIFPMETKRKRE